MIFFHSLPFSIVSLLLFSLILATFFKTSPSRAAESQSVDTIFPSLYSATALKNILNRDRHDLMDQSPLQSPTFYLTDYPLQANSLVHETMSAKDKYRITYPWLNNITVQPVMFSPNQTSSIAYQTTSDLMNTLSFIHTRPNLIIQGRYLYDDGYKQNTDRELGNFHLQFKQTFDHLTVHHHSFVDHIDQNDVSFVIGKESYKSQAIKDTSPLSHIKNDATQFLYFANMLHQPDEKKALQVTPYLRINQVDQVLQSLPGLPVQQSTSGSTGFFSSFTRPYSEKTELTTRFDMDYTYADYRQRQEQHYSEQYPTGVHYDFIMESLTFNWRVIADQQLTESINFLFQADINKSHYFHRNALPNGSACPDAINDCHYFRPEQRQLNFFNGSPLVALSYAWQDNHEISISLYQKYRILNSLDLFRLQEQQQIKSIKPEKTDAAEIHVKGHIQDRIDYQMTLFLRQIDHLMVSNDLGINLFNEHVQSFGLNSDIQVILSNELSVALNLSVNNTEYTDGVLHAINGKNKRLKLLPDSSARFLTQWAPIDNTQIQFEWIYLGQYYLDDNNSKRYPGHQLFNMKWQHTFSNAWHLSFAIENIADRRYAEIAEITQVTALMPVAREKYIVGLPRTFRLGVAKSF